MTQPQFSANSLQFIQKHYYDEHICMRYRSEKIGLSIV